MPIRLAERNLVVLDAKKAPSRGKTKNRNSEKREKVEGFDLFLVYMTPWKNPNSIFVYMILIIEILGKFREMAQ